MSELGRRLRELRLQKGYTLDRLADLAGISSSYLWRLEKGERQPSEEVLRCLAGHLGVDYYSLYVLLKNETPEFDLREALTSPAVCIKFNGNVLTNEKKDELINILNNQD